MIGKGSVTETTVVRHSVKYSVDPLWVMVVVTGYDESDVYIVVDVVVKISVVFSVRVKAVVFSSVVVEYMFEVSVRF